MLSVGMPTVAPGSFPQNPRLNFAWEEKWLILKTPGPEPEDLPVRALALQEEMRCRPVCLALGTTSSFTKEEANSWGFV